MTTGSDPTEDELKRLEALCDPCQHAFEACEALPRLTAAVRRLRALADESMRLVETRTRERDARIAELERERDALQASGELIARERAEARAAARRLLDALQDRGAARFQTLPWERGQDHDD